MFFSAIRAQSGCRFSEPSGETYDCAGTEVRSRSSREPDVDLRDDAFELRFDRHSAPDGLARELGRDGRRGKPGAAEIEADERRARDQRDGDERDDDRHANAATRSQAHRSQLLDTDQAPEPGSANDREPGERHARAERTSSPPPRAPDEERPRQRDGAQHNGDRDAHRARLAEPAHDVERKCRRQRDRQPDRDVDRSGDAQPPPRARCHARRRVETALRQDAARELGRLAEPLGLCFRRLRVVPGRFGQKRPDLGDDVVGVLGARGSEFRAQPREVALDDLRCGARHASSPLSASIASPMRRHSAWARVKNAAPSCVSS